MVENKGGKVRDSWNPPDIGQITSKKNRPAGQISDGRKQGGGKGSRPLKSSRIIADTPPKKIVLRDKSQMVENKGGKVEGGGKVRISNDAWMNIW